MQLLVRNLQGRTITVSAEGSDTVADLKHALEVRLVAVEAWRRACGAGACCRLPLTTAAALRCRHSAATCASLARLRVQAKDGLPARYQSLVHAGRLLLDGAALADCGLAAGATVQQCSRLLGGKPVKVAVLQGARSSLIRRCRVGS